MLDMYKEYIETLYSFSKRWYENKTSQKYQKQIWIDNIGGILEQRELRLYQTLKKTTQNKTAMDHTIEYINNKKLLQSLNHI